MADLINIPTKSSGDTLSAGEVNTIVNKTNDAITEQNQTKATHEQALANKVDKVTGKGLSTEDFTTAEKNKLAGVAAGANDYIHPATHPLSMITETDELKVMTAAERTKLAGLSEHDKGFFANEAAIVAAIPTGQAGWFVRNGETDTVWVWDVEGSAWVDTGSAGGGTSYLEVTYAQAIAAMGAGTLVPGAMYKITDRGDRGLFFNAISTTQFAASGTRLMLCPATYAAETDAHGNAWLGVWHDGLTPAVNNLAIWGGHVWKNLTGAVGTSDDDITLDSTNWVLVAKATFANYEYVELVFGVQFDWANDWIEKQWDGNGNILGLTYYEENNEDWGEFLEFNPVDCSDWNYASSILFANNQALLIMNNICSAIADNTLKRRTIKNNIVASSIIGNTNKGDINSNICSSITENCNIGRIMSNVGNHAIWWNSSQTGIIANLSLVEDISDNPTNKVSGGS